MRDTVYHRSRAMEGYDEGLRAFMHKAFIIMAAGLAITAAITAYISHAPGMMESLFGLYTYTEGGETKTGYNPGFWFIGAALGQLAIVIVLGWGGFMGKISSGTAYAIFAVYAVLTAITISPVVYAYTTASVAKVFLITAIMFTGSAIYGAVTKSNLTGWGDFLFMALLGLIAAMVINIFMQSAQMDYIISIAAVLLFTVLVAFDVQKLEEMYREQAMDSSETLAVYGALTLYLDFINMFLHLLRLFGVKTKD